MSSTIPLGRIAGIRLGAHWSVVLVAALIAWTLGAYVLPELEPGYDTVSYWLMGVVVALVFFASLLAHELGHSVVARRQGIAVEEITLWLLGGVSKMQSDSRTAGDEFRMAAVGPLISLALGVGFGLLAGAARLAGVPDLIVAGIIWLSATNLLLGVFNLLPAFPLDGGRLLRAILWHRTGDRVRATQSAARAGQTFGYALIALGVAELLFGGIGGLWLVLLGWFVTQAAQAEAGMVAQRELLSGVTVGEIMTPNPVTAPASITVEELIDRYVLGSRHSAYPIWDPDRRIVGLVTLDVIRRVPPDERSTTRLSEVALVPPAVVVSRSGEKVTELLTRMATVNARRALVVDDGTLTGIVSMTDIGRTIDTRQLAHGAARPEPAAAHG